MAMESYDGEIKDDGGDASERAATYERWVETALRPTLDDCRERRDTITSVATDLQ